MIGIDGSMGEGGGQIVRSAVSLAAITGQDIEITDIRAQRERPGLMPQHLTAVKAVGKVCGARVENADLDSRRLRFFPQGIRSGNYRFDVGTAGSAVMIAQAIIPPLLLAEGPSRIWITGGTHVPKSPSYDYLERVFCRAIRSLGAAVEVRLARAGYFPKGGGQIDLHIFPSKLHGQKDWLRETAIQGIIRISNLPHHVAERERDALASGGAVSLSIYDEPSFSEGNSLTIWRGFCGSCALGRRGIPAEAIAQEALLALLSETHDVDRHLADQLLIYAALASGRTAFMTSVITDHLKTNARVVESLTGRKVKIETNLVEID